MTPNAPMPVPGLTRSRLLRLLGGAAASTWFSAPVAGQSIPSASPAPMASRAIASSGEAIPVIGCGTWVGFDHPPGSAEYARLPGVLSALFAAGGRMIDSSPMYGRSERTTGELLSTSAPGASPFLATKVWTRGREAGLAQMEESFARLQTRRIDLMQVHNLVDWRTQLASVGSLKDQGRVRYVGITHYTSSAFDEVEAVLRAEKLGFLQINYSLDDREVEKRLLPLAAQRGVAVIVNQPFGGGGLLRTLRERPLPGWAAEIGCTSWAQVLLKFVLGNAAVTCVIPGTSRPEHMADNARAGTGPIPDAAFWRRHAASVLS
jgi:diketogulonate reductase-like aldo/keto reductase